jgi:hypothetical protein
MLGRQRKAAAHSSMSRPVWTSIETGTFISVVEHALLVRVSATHTGVFVLPQSLTSSCDSQTHCTLKGQAWARIQMVWLSVSASNAAGAIAFAVIGSISTTHDLLGTFCGCIFQQTDT